MEGPTCSHRSVWGGGPGREGGGVLSFGIQRGYRTSGARGLVRGISHYTNRSYERGGRKQRGALLENSKCIDDGM